MERQFALVRQVHLFVVINYQLLWPPLDRRVRRWCVQSQLDRCFPSESEVVAGCSSLEDHYRWYRPHRCCSGNQPELFTSDSVWSQAPLYAYLNPNQRSRAYRQYKYSVSQKIPPDFFLTFSPNGWDFLVQILHAYSTFLSTLQYTFFTQLPATVTKLRHIKRDHHYMLKMFTISWNARWVFSLNMA